ncbi:AAC(3) family N-acetyltransferase [Kineothrix sp. MB12-C1]|uniref:AAC(3) family N-acetyltransferase n=1 Tax=Kineothrix sp. MB12-C1 TaxID=3070215 RepID=UPI0027D2AC13|nr:AAC(3) family N-acetyltransferase [Kineothrix sp. MB12-C1]WMC94309.1 AAC(3) family N-acetyltransferase [Kineothrix sp. MB12-C1]
MYTKRDLLESLDRIGVDRAGTLMVQLSCKAIGEVEGRGDTVLDALMEYMESGLLVLAAHTWDNVDVKNPVMDVLYTPSCVGFLTERFRKRPGVYRSLHPTHSLSAYGKDAKEFIAGEEKISTPCGEGGAYHRLWQRNAQILLIGVNFTRNTYIHGVEEWDGAEGSISDQKTDLYVINEEGRRIYTPQYRHCSALGSEVFSKLEPQAVQEGILTLGRFGDATTRLMRAVSLREMIAPLLQEDTRYLMRY